MTMKITDDVYICVKEIAIIQKKASAERGSCQYRIRLQQDFHS